jgi:cobalt-zinc-cadmium efflux system outer membrane protein
MTILTVALAVVPILGVGESLRGGAEAASLFAASMHGAKVGCSLAPHPPTQGAGSDAAPLTLQAAIDQALARNPRLVALRRQVEAARHRPLQVVSLPPPRLEAQIWRWPVTTLDPRRVDMYMLMLTQDLPRGEKRRLRAAVAESERDLAEAALAVEARALIDEVKRAYAELFVARRAVELHQASAALLRQFIDLSRTKYASGRISQHDVLKAVLELSALHATLVELTARAAVAEARLNTLLDEPPDRPIGRLAEPREQVALPPLAALERRALGEAPEVRQARLDVERAERALAAAQAEGRPDLMVTGGYFASPLGEDGWTAGIGVTWPGAPWARRGLAARIGEAQSQLDAARARLRATENAVRFAVNEAYRRAQAAETRAALLRTTILPQSDQTLEVSRIAYETDRVDFLAVIDSQRALLDARLEYVRALVERDQALADLERVIGLGPAEAPVGTLDPR